MKTLDVQRYYKPYISAKEGAGRPKAAADGAKKDYKRTEKTGRVANYMEWEAKQL